MADRKQFITHSKASPELLRLLQKAKETAVTEADLQEQRLSFAFGNALNREFVTKDSVKYTSQHTRLRA
jgi:acyl-coenzyme A synthetase/AMP-(fatty) acid ligase